MECPVLRKLIRQLYSPKYLSKNSLNQLVTTLFPDRSCRHKRCQRRYYDTFDWRLFKAGFLLEEDILNDRHMLRLRSMSEEAMVIEVENTRVPEFYWDLPCGPLRNRLKSLLCERALIAMGEACVNRTYYEIYDKEEKIILRIVTEELFSNNKRHAKNNITAYLELQPLRGYEQEMSSVYDLLEKEFEFNFCRKNPALVLFESFGKTPEDYTSKLEIDLERDMPSHAALSSALIYNLDIMEKNEIGIVKDIDIEFLHDFRIAGRRSRSVLGQMRDVFPQTPLTRYKNILSWLSKLTSSHRDFDVFLWDFDDYVKQVSRNGGEELEPLRRFIERRRAQEHKKLIKALNTKRFDQFKNDWRHFLEYGQHRSLNAAMGTVPIIDVANQSIWRNYRKVLRQGDIIKTNYTFDSIHTLRKNSKKLRYLMDTFKSLYPDQDILVARKCLKKLQNNLGEITDMHVQRNMLDHWKIVLTQNKKIPQITISAIDELENQCTVNEMSAQKKFKLRFRDFSSKSNQQLFKDIFK